MLLSGFGSSGKVVTEIEIPPNQQTRPEIECDESLKDCCVKFIEQSKTPRF